MSLRLSKTGPGIGGPAQTTEAITALPIVDVTPSSPTSNSDEKLEEKYSVSDRADSPQPDALFVKGEPVIQTGR